MPAINLPPTLPDLEHFAASSAMSGCASPGVRWVEHIVGTLYLDLGYFSRV